MEGRVYLSRRGSTDNELSKWSGVCIYSLQENASPATAIAFNPNFDILAIGNMSGVVTVYELVQENGNNHITANFSHECIVGNNQAPIRLGHVSSLSWTVDGFALAVGWLFGGASVWSVYGACLMSTISEDTSIYSSDGVITNTTELYFTGIQDLFWGPADFTLFMLPSPRFDNEIITDIFVLDFAKSSLLNCSTSDNSRRICLVSTDRIILYVGVQPGNTSISIDTANWDTIHIPTLYLNENWPVNVNFYFILDGILQRKWAISGNIW